MTYQTRQKQSDAPGFFWTPADQVSTERVRLFGDEARHARTVCRVRVGEMITVTDGEGNAHDCEIESVTPRELTGRIVRSHRRLGEPLAQVTLAAAVGKPSTFDWMVEKAVELGVVRIIPVRAAGSPAGIGGKDAAKRRVERWRRLVLGAMKQSMRSVRPPVDDIATPEDVAGQIKQYHSTWLADPEGTRLPERTESVAGTIHALVIVGPGAGFTAGEAKIFLDAGATGLTLGDRRLRAETAALTALTLIMRNLGEL